MRPNLKTTFVALACAAAGPASAAAAAIALTERLAVETRDGKVLLHVSFENRGKRTLYVPASLARDDEPEGNLFEIVDTASGAPLAYTGKMVKRGPLGRDDYVAIAPHSLRRNTIDLSRSYAFARGAHSYSLTAPAHFLPTLEALDAPVALAPAPASFRHSVP
ncbi:MAG: hypothetical protein V4582_12245 [Pseudomonadota bacterium]